MKFIINGKLINQEQPEESKKCKHNKIIITKIEDTKYRHCKSCGMKAHEDGSFAHYCGLDWCKCSQ